MTVPHLRALLLRPVLAASGAGVLALGLPGVAAAGEVNNDWAGYVAASSTYTSVTATWTQPTLRCTSAETEIGTWVGLDGYTSDTLEQIGTEMTCIGGTASYYAWYELYPDPAVEFDNKTVKPGDSITATVTEKSGGDFTLKIANTTEGWTASAGDTGNTAQRSSAEVVLELPAGVTTEPESGSITFTAAKVDGESLGAADPTRLSSPDASCGSLVDGTEFTCTWE